MNITPETRLSDIGEKRLVKEILSLMPTPAKLIDGFGHDSAFIDMSVGDDEVLLLNTDRSGANIACRMGLADGRCVGDFGVSHAVSDILASGGDPVAVSMALLLPPDERVTFVREIVTGAVQAAGKYGAFVAAGDTKHNPKFAMVVTAVGKCRKNERLTRSGARPGDLIVVTGPLGTMAGALLGFGRGVPMSDAVRTRWRRALVYQNPPYAFARLMARARLAHAAMDNSDGLAGSLYTMCAASGVGARIRREAVPMDPDVVRLAQSLNIDPFGLALASGDWRFLYAVPEAHLEELACLASGTGTTPVVIGRFVEDETHRVVMTEGDSAHVLRRVENDRFGVGGTDFFDRLTQGRADYLTGETTK